MEKAKFYAHNIKMNSQLLYDPNNLISEYNESAVFRS